MWAGIVTCPAIVGAIIEAQEMEKRMNARQLTTIAALPSGAGCMSALPAEVGEQPVKVQMKSPYFQEPRIKLGLDWGDYLKDCQGPGC